MCFTLGAQVTPPPATDRRRTRFVGAEPSTPEALGSRATTLQFQPNAAGPAGQRASGRAAALAAMARIVRTNG
jgi:hypothetical protein